MQRIQGGLKTHNKGFTLLDTLIGIVIFILIALTIFQAFQSVQRLVSRASLKAAAATILTQQLEIIRTLNYADVGVSGGIPAGILPQDYEISRNYKRYNIHTIIRSVDDPFDGTLGGTPNDTSPGDYKLVELTVTCLNCLDAISVQSSTTVAPKNLETSTGNGALFVQVFNANGQPVNQATVQVNNPSLLPPVSFTDVTDSDGWLRLIDVPPAVESYEITVTKSNYSSDQTYPTGEPSNPNPVKTHATIVADSITQVSFAIDETSTLTINTLNSVCNPIGGVDFNLTGSKLIGTDPDVVKYDVDHTTDSIGESIISSMEWDTYQLTLTDPGFYLAGSLPSIPVELQPGTDQTMTLIVEPRTTNALLVEVEDATTQLPIAQANVTLTGPGYDKQLTTGEGHWQQTDWSGGSGQVYATDPTRFLTTDGNADIDNPVGELRLRDLSGGTYPPSTTIESSTFDNTTTTNYYALIATPQDQPIEAGTDPIRIQIASNSDDATWLFLGPDGTSNTYYTPNDRTLNSAHSADQYIRYRVQLLTDSSTTTPNLSDIALSFASECIPSGQTYFNDIFTGEYTIIVDKTGYESYNNTIDLVSGWQKTTIQLTPL